MEASVRRPSIGSIGRLFPFLKPYRVWIAAKLLALILGACNDIFVVYVISKLLNSALTGDRAGTGESIVMLVSSVLAGVVLSFTEMYSSGRFTANALRDIRQAFSEHINKLQVSELESRHSGEIQTRMSSSMTALEDFLGGTFTTIIYHIIRMSVCLAFMLYMNSLLTVLCIGIIVVTAVATILISRPLHEYSKTRQRMVADSNAAIQDAIGGIMLIKSFNLTPLFNTKYQGLITRLLTNSLAIEKRKAIIASASVFVSLAPFIMFFLLGGALVIQDKLTIGALLAFAQFIGYLVQGMGMLPSQFGHYKQMAGVTEHMFELLDGAEERMDGIIPAVALTSSAITFEQVSFTYDGNKKVLDRVSFALPRGKMAALVGPSGSGKSTVFKLIAGYCTPSEGTIKLFDEPLEDWNLQAARSSIALVSQDTFLFPGTIADNIACGDPKVPIEEIQEAARLANIHDFIVSLPSGYSTIVGERGVNFSGGQKQRLSIARAILKNAPVLLLDEATSALDTESERFVQEAIGRILKDRTVLVVAHRLSTIMDADEIIVMDNGRIAETGTHDELLDRSGIYGRLYRNQTSNDVLPITLAAKEGA